MIMKKSVILLFSLMIIMTACNLPGIRSYITLPSGSKVKWVKLDPNGSPTSTPFLPVMEEVVTPNPETDKTEGELAIPTEYKPQRPEGQVNILVLGSDYRPESGYRTDVFMLLSIYPNQGTASILSFPRDLYVYLPGIGNQRINVAQPFGGFALSKATLEENFGVTADYYIMTNFQGFKGIINSLGGITVNAGSYLSDHCELPQGDASKNCTVYAGPNYMNGDTALWYVRSRYTTSDFDRTRRAQEVMFAIFEKLMSLDALSRVPELYNLYLSSVDTDLGLTDIVPLMPVTSQILSDPSRLRRYAIGDEHVSHYVLPDSGANVLIPNYELIEEIIIDSAFTP
jgi:LCP family protein required for cell wall assembly